MIGVAILINYLNPFNDIDINLEEYKKKLENLKNRQNFWDKQDKAYQAACKRPGSQKK